MLVQNHYPLTGIKCRATSVAKKIDDCIVYGIDDEHWTTQPLDLKAGEGAWLADSDQSGIDPISQ